MTFIEQLAFLGVDFRVAGENIQICCPYCSERGETTDTRFRLGINPTNGKAQCFNCGWRSRKQSAEYVLRKLGATNVRLDDSDSHEEVAPVTLPSDFQRLTNAFSDDDDRIREAYVYTRKRGVTHRQIVRHRIGVSLSGEMAYRVVFPIYHEKKLAMVQGRSFVEETHRPKYLTRGEKTTFFNWNPPMRGIRVAHVAEGIFKALTLERAFPKVNAVASLGSTITEAQADLLMSVDSVIIWSDPDGPGVVGTLRSLELLNAHPNLVVVAYKGRPLDEIPTNGAAVYYRDYARPYSPQVHGALELLRAEFRQQKQEEVCHDHV